MTSDRLPLSIKLCFGAPGFAGAALGIPIGLYLPQFYSDTVLVPLGWVAVAIALARAFDAITDPLMGWVTDRTRSRWGRRKPWIFVGVPLCALSFYALFSPPSGLEPGQAALWFGLSFGLYFLFHTVYAIPHAALGAEVALAYHERSSLFGIQAIFIQSGVIATSAVLAAALNGVDPEGVRAAYSTVAIGVGALLIGLYGLLLWRVPERTEFASRESNPLVPGVRRALRNRPFCILFFAGLVNAIPAAIPAILMRYYTIYVIRPADPERWFAIFLVTFILTGTLFIPVWVAVARRFGKLASFCSASVLGIVGSALFFLAGEGDTYYALGVFFLVGTQSSAGTFLIPAMAADTIDYDELLTGKRREAQFSAFWSIIPKFVSIPGSSIPIAILAVVGYVPNAVQTPDVIFTIKFLYALFPIVFYVTALSILLRYPISEAAHAQIREGTAAHARGETVRDPLADRLLPPPTKRGLDQAVGWFLDYFSAGELRRALQHGSARLVRDVWRACGLTLALLVGTCALLARDLTALRGEPGPAIVLEIVVAGLALTAFLFHALRIGPARRAAAGALRRDQVEAHLQGI